MNSPSAAFRPAVSEVLLTILSLTVIVAISWSARHYLPAPPGRDWLWLPAASGLAVAWGFSRSRHFPAYRFVMLYGLAGLAVQAVVQGLFAAGIRF